MTTENFPTNKPLLAINYHILEECNFGCKYCFAEWDPCQNQPIVINSRTHIRKLLDEIKKLEDLPWFRPTFRGVRLNIAGGEPLLKWQKGLLPYLIDEALERDIPCSIITNASLLTDDVLNKLAPKLTILGISLDSDNTEVNRRIGRGSKSYTVGRSPIDANDLIPLLEASAGSSTAKPPQNLSAEQVALIFELARKLNPDIECKLNTVVCAYNYNDNMSDAIEIIQPDRWKIFKMLPVTGSQGLERQEKQDKLAITDEQYYHYTATHKEFNSIMQPENNDEMTESYLMIDPYGRLFQNTTGTREYVYSDPISESGIVQALKQIEFSCGKYNSRQLSAQVKTD